MASLTNPSQSDRLNSWKSIAAYFERDERTVKRWEAERGLPVRRIPGAGRSSVYAYAHELDQWLKTADADSPLPLNGTIPRSAPSVPLVALAPSSESHPAPFWPLWNRRRVAVSVVVAALSILSLAAYRRLPSRSLASSPPAGLEHSANPGAKELYLQGLYHWNKRTAADLNQALGEFNQSIARDPNYAPAYVGLANCYNLLREYSLMPSSEAYPRAIAAAQRAIALDDSLAEAHNSLAFGDFYWLWDAAGAEYQFRRSIVLNANSALAHHWYATFLMVLARFDESLAEIEKARALDPTSSAILADKGLVLYAAGRPNEAIALLQGLEKSEPDFLSPHAYLGTVYLEMRNFKGYLPEAKRSALLLKDKDRLAVVTAGEKGFATGAGAGMLRQMLRVQQSLYLQDKISAYELATTYSLLGDRQHALDLLQISVQKREARDVALRIDQNFDGLHDQPAFRTLLAKVGLPPLS